jgi:predicted metal-dependent hydrolase
MSSLSKPERATQDRVAALFRDELGYRHLGDWADRANDNIDDGLLSAHLATRGYSPAHISASLHTLRSEAHHPQRALMANNQAVYSLLRYGVPVKTQAGVNTDTVNLIDWQNPQNNDFAIAEEVTLKGGHERRPDIVLYLNGLAIAVLELKNSRVSVGEGIRQNLSNQQPEFNAWFFSTVQFVFAGNDSEGLRYGSVGTEAKYFLAWKEAEADNTRFKLDKYLLKMCAKERLLELVHDFVLFDGGVKKLPRVHQYFGLKAAQAHVQRRQGGIVWLRRTEADAAPFVIAKRSTLVLQVRPGTAPERCQQILEAWYREQLREALAPLLAKWQPVMGVHVKHVFVQRMRTRWGSCNPGSGAIRLNTELARKPAECLEYIVVHEMTHLLERTHNERFAALMSKWLPHWQHLRQALNRLPVRHEDWGLTAPRRSGLLHRAGAHAQHRVERATVQRCSEERHQANPAPHADGAGERECDQREAGERMGAG